VANPAYATPAYRKGRARLLADQPMCVHCRCRVATEADHQPPLRLHAHLDGSDCCQLVASCSVCARRQGAILAGRVTAARLPVPAKSVGGPPSPTVEPVGYPPADPVWDVAWLTGLRDVPGDATWPRLMTPPHPQAVGSYGDDLAAYALERTGKPLRWWQRLYAARALEHDQAGMLVWDACDLTVARQVGKSYLMREACLWRMHQGGRFDEPQTVVHTGKDLPVCVEIQRPARRWARSERFADVYKVRDANGQEQIEYLADGSRWLVKAKESVYGLSASMAVVDEAWAVPATMIEEGLVPTMVELAAAQLWLVSTAHRKATALMVARRNAALADLDGYDADLWVEWSAAPGVDLDDEAGWRQASPHWTDRRRRLIAQRLTAARSGESDDPDEPDPFEAFAAQWLNRWPTVRRKPGHGEPLLDAGVWDDCAGALDAYDGPGIVALEENRGTGAAAAFVASDGAGRFEVDGRACASWSDAIDLVRGFVDARPGARLIVGARLNNQLPADLPGRMGATRAGTTETGRGLVLLRALAAERRVFHDDTVMLDDQIARARVHNLAGGGLGLVNNNARTDLLRACLWALDAAQVTPPSPAIR
jgi:hypothetical protein